MGVPGPFLAASPQEFALPVLKDGGHVLSAKKTRTILEKVASGSLN